MVGFDLLLPTRLLNRMHHIYLADKLWDLANLVTGFVAAQNPAFIDALAKDELHLLRGAVPFCRALWGTIDFNIGYVAAIVPSSLQSLLFKIDPSRVLAQGARS